MGVGCPLRGLCVLGLGVGGEGLVFFIKELGLGFRVSHSGFTLKGFVLRVQGVATIGCGQRPRFLCNENI